MTERGPEGRDMRTTGYVNRIGSGATLTQIDLPELQLSLPDMHRSMYEIPICHEYRFFLEPTRHKQIIGGLDDIFIHKPAERSANYDPEKHTATNKVGNRKYLPIYPETVLLGFTAMRIQIFVPGFDVRTREGKKTHNRAIGLARVYNGGTHEYIAEQHYPNLRPELRQFYWLNPDNSEVRIFEEMSTNLLDKKTKPKKIRSNQRNDINEGHALGLINMINVVQNGIRGFNLYTEGKRGTFFKHQVFQKYDRAKIDIDNMLPFGDNHFIPGEN